MIFGAVINENLKDEIVVTVIATGFSEVEQARPASRPNFGQTRPQANPNPVKREAPKREERETYSQEPSRSSQSGSQNNQDEALDIPTFLRNRNRRR